MKTTRHFLTVLSVVNRCCAMLLVTSLALLIELNTVPAVAKNLDFEERCNQLSSFDLQIPPGESIDNVQMVSSEVRDVGLPSEHCAVVFEIDIDASQPWFMTAIHFFPKNFSGRFMHTGGGGSWSGYLGVANTQLMELGFAQGQMNNDSLQQGLLWLDYDVNDEADAAFSRDGLHFSTVVGRQLLNAFYGKPADYSYYIGCSTGGNQGAQAAIYHPDTFDGVAIGAPAFYTQAFFMLNELFRKQLDDPSSVLTDPFANPQVRQAVLERCDGLDGYVDGVIDWPHRCDPDLDELGADIGLSANDIALLKEAVSPRMAIGNSSIGPIALKAFGYPIENEWPGSGFTANIFAYQFWAAMDPTYPSTDNGDYGKWATAFLAFDFNDQSYVDQMAEWSISVFGGKREKSLRDFGDAGGKIIVYHTWPDAILSMNETIDWIDTMIDMDGRGKGAVKQYLRFYQKTTGGHCAANGDVLRDALIEWVENGNIEKSLLLDAPVSNRPACEYPKVPVLKDAEKDKWDCLPPQAAK